jgi:antitoxin (DNA-binding transcriptional repressor) of toxin-antitoxin stability system
MHSVNLRQLRDTRQLKAGLKAGETVELRERDTVLAKIVPEETLRPPVEWPNFEARRRRIFGDRLFEENGVLEARKDSRY